MFERILVPLDGSPRAELILNQVARILRREDSELLFVRTVSPIADLHQSGEKESSMDTARHAAEQYIKDLVARFKERGAHARGRVLVGSAPETILAVAEEEGSTMIAMTTHGRTGISRWLMGSVAEKVVRASSVPVLLIRAFRSTAPGPSVPATAEELPFRKLLVPTDGSAASLAVVAPAGELAGLFASEIVVLHVERPYVATGAILPGMEAGAMSMPSEPTPSQEDEATRKAAEGFHHAGLHVTRRTVLGDPASEILDQSSGSGIDLIALSTHGRSGFSRWLTGSVTERVLRHADVPLLIVRAAGMEPDRSHPEVVDERKKVAPIR
ncbi:MAG TPA: universal stress protein [Planctomycetota bacterium]|nr:universal stress protein [Planctomycetota bacterium]